MNGINSPFDQQYNPFTKYCHLLEQYAVTSYFYHHQMEANAKMSAQYENLCKQKIDLLQQKGQSRIVSVSQSEMLMPGLSDERLQHSASSQKHTARSKRRMIKKSHTHQSRSAFRCTYANCSLVYRSAASLNLHIKLKHNGGTKRQREAYAKSLLNNSQNPHVSAMNLNLPPSFLEEFKKTYEYTKKYNM